VRLAFLLVLALVAFGIARGDFASGEARTDERPLVQVDSLRADSLLTPEASGAHRSPLSRVRAHLAPEAD